MLQYTPANKNPWFKKHLAEICRFNTPKYKNLCSQAKSNGFLNVGWIMTNNLTKECNFEL